jgi:hypothetical protein
MASNDETNMVVNDETWRDNAYVTSKALDLIMQTP